MKQDLIRYLNQQILSRASKLSYRVSEHAPSTFEDLQTAPSLVVWSGASDQTIFQDASVNWAFRAIHDTEHLRTGLQFEFDHELELGRIQANQFDSETIQRLIYIETAGQSIHYKTHGYFPINQAQFTINEFLKKG